MSLYYICRCTGCSAVWLAYLHGVQVVGGSNPLIPTRRFKPGVYTGLFCIYASSLPPQLRHVFLPNLIFPVTAYITESPHML